MLVHEDEAARIGQPLDAGNSVNAAERRQHHGEFEGQIVGALVLAASSTSMTCISLHRPRGLGVDDPFDMTLAESGFQQPLSIADAAQTQMADIGLRADESHRHLVAQLPPAQIGIEDHGELIGRPEAGGALHGADDHGAGISAEFSQAALVAAAWPVWQMECVWPPSGPRPGTSSKARSGPVAITR